MIGPIVTSKGILKCMQCSYYYFVFVHLVYIQRNPRSESIMITSTWKKQATTVL